MIDSHRSDDAGVQVQAVLGVDGKVASVHLEAPVELGCASTLYPLDEANSNRALCHLDQDVPKQLLSPDGITLIYPEPMTVLGGSDGDGALEGDQAHSDTATLPEGDPCLYDMDTPAHEVPLTLLPQLVVLANSSNVRDAQRGVMLIRKLLEATGDGGASEVVASGVVATLVTCMEQTESTPLLRDASWAVAKVASGSLESVMCVLSANAVPACVRRLASQDSDVVEHAAWAIGVIAGTSYQCRDYCLECEAVNPLLDAITESFVDQSKIRTTSVARCVKALSNLCRFKPSPPEALITRSIPVLLTLTRNPAPEIAVEALWGLVHISESPDGAATIIDGRVVRVVMDVLSSIHAQYRTPVVAFIRNIVGGTDIQTLAALDAGVLPRLRPLLDPTYPSELRRMVMATLSQLCTGSRTYIDYLIAAQMVPDIVQTMSAHEPDVVKEAFVTASNIATHGSLQQVNFVVGCGLLEKLVNTLRSTTDVCNLTSALKLLEAVLRVGDKFAKRNRRPTNFYVESLISLDCSASLRNVNDVHKNDAVRELAHQLNTSYFVSSSVSSGCAPIQATDSGSMWAEVEEVEEST